VLLRWWGLPAVSSGALVSGWAVFVVASLWWWGVVFDLWIVVASIFSTQGYSSGFRFGGVLLCVF
jgi:hypothetical protein